MLPCASLRGAMTPIAPMPATPSCLSRASPNLLRFSVRSWLPTPVCRWNVIRCQVGTQPSEHVVLMGNLHPTQARGFPARGKEPDAALPQSRLRPAIDQLSLHGEGEYVAVNIHVHPVQHVFPRVDESSGIGPAIRLAMNHGVPRYPDGRHRSRLEDN